MKISPYLVTLLILASCTKNQSNDSHKAHQTPVPAETENNLMLTESQIRLANITTQPAGKRSIGETIPVNGWLKVDELQSKVISSRVAGRIEKLFIKETGQPVKAGQPLYVLYSETLLTLQAEYLLAKDQYEALGKTETRYKSFLEAAERKLLLYGLTKNQINQLTPASQQQRITFVAPSSGIITALNVAEGEYVSEGGLLYTLENIENLWVEAELYPDETSLIQPGDIITVRVGNESQEGKVIFLSPEYRAQTQLTILRASLKNPGLKLIPGQQAQVYLTHSSREAITLPPDAVIRDSRGTHVYIQTEKNTFQPRAVKTGIENFDSVEIISGIREGEIIAVSGAYLLYAENILKNGYDRNLNHQH